MCVWFFFRFLSLKKKITVNYAVVDVEGKLSTTASLDELIDGWITCLLVCLLAGLFRNEMTTSVVEMNLGFFFWGGGCLLCKSFSL